MPLSLADAAREYGSVEEWKPSSDFLTALAKGGRTLQEWMENAKIPIPTGMGKNASSREMPLFQMLMGNPGRGIDRVAHGELPNMLPGFGGRMGRVAPLDPDLLDAAMLAGGAAGPVAKGVGRGTTAFVDSVGRELGNYSLRAPGGPMAQAGKVSVKGDTRPKVLVKLTDQFASPEAAAEVAATPIAKEAKLGDYPTTTARRIAKETKQGGGYSVNLATGKRPEEGFMVGKYRNEDPRNVVIEGYPTPKPIETHAETNIKALQDPEHYLGTWFDTEGGKTYLDVSKRFERDKLRAATKAGEKTNQKKIWNLHEGKEEPVGNWEEFVKSPEFKERMRELQQEGADYMSKQGTPDWWDMHGTSFEDTYGAQNLPQLAGFTASTAPVTPLRQNVQQASEYMRRHIKGEPIVQPEWRAGPGLLSTREGTMMPMETGRAKNLTAASEGRLEDLSAEKVNAEARAMMGDPRAIVLDRHHIHASEDPSRGIYAQPAPHVIESKQYGVLEKEMAGMADEIGIEPRTYSANLWAGIRERVRNTGELFGTKHSRPPGESKSYVDHQQDLIREKAAHLGITPEEMKKRLKAGDDNLLAYLLATPGVAALVAASHGVDDEAQQ